MGFLIAMRDQDWRIVCQDGESRAKEAIAILETGLTQLGCRLSEQSQREILLNVFEDGHRSFTWRAEPERIEIHASGAEDLSLAVCDFLDDLRDAQNQGQGDSAGDELKEAVSRRGRGQSPFSRRGLVFAPFMPGAERLSWSQWGRGQGFTHFTQKEGSDGSSPYLIVGQEAGNDQGLYTEIASRLAAAESSQSAGELILLLGIDQMAAALAALAEGLARHLPPSARALVSLCLDDKDRCYGHALGEGFCQRNLRFSAPELRSGILAWRNLGFGGVILRLNGADDSLFPCLAPPLFHGLGDDLDLAQSLGMDGVEAVVGAYSPYTGRLAFWSLGRALYPRGAFQAPASHCPSLPEECVVAGYLGQALLGRSHEANLVWEPNTLELGVDGKAGLLKLAQHELILSKAWATALWNCPVTPERPAGRPMDFWDDGVERQIEMANLYPDIYSLLDKCGAELKEAEGLLPGLSGIRGLTRVFAAQEAALELSGVMRSFYAEVKSPQASPNDLGMVAEVALAEAERSLSRACHGDRRGALARAQLLTDYGTKIGELMTRHSPGPLSGLYIRLRSLLRGLKLSALRRGLAKGEYQA